MWQTVIVVTAVVVLFITIIFFLMRPAIVKRHQGKTAKKRMLNHSNETVAALKEEAHSSIDLSRQNSLDEKINQNKLKKENEKGEVVIRTVAMPADTNPSGNIFGGWIVSQMDLAGSEFCKNFANANVVTVAIDAMEFIEPVYVGDFVSCYVKMIRVGTTSMTVHIETWAHSSSSDNPRKVTEGMFIYVSVDGNNKPVPIAQ